MNNLTQFKLTRNRYQVYYEVKGTTTYIYLPSYTLPTKNIDIKIFRIIILPVLLCGCETWSLTFREEHRVRVFENRMLRRTFGPKRDEVTGEWRKLYNKELNDLYCSPNNQVTNSRRIHGRDMWHAWGRGEVHTGF